MTAWSKDELIAFEQLAMDIEDGQFDASRLPPLERPVPENASAVSISLSDGRRLTRVKIYDPVDYKVLYVDFLTGWSDGAQVPLA
ncbi:hypothetical protein [Sphingomonas sp. SRS2]|uniref:hypothetical protein n=1 Tax=Sphingomonas sp. SRS2 TaxID=133190 RepID=UPI00061845E6|nr:hypothetical protein [Sphingomonas sp. SRS2]KKC25823.1 hypothetical protein WP12_12275 [Sphingomonas sp. SRS2]